MTIEKIIANRQQGIVTCTASNTVEEAGRKLSEFRIGAMPVLEDGKVVGIFSERDLLHCIASEGANGLARRVGVTMTAPAITIDRSVTVIEALSLMTRRRVRHLPVLDGANALVGFVSIGDLVKYRIDKIEAEAEQMREYIQMA